ncbi:hypothetical protein [uncultured Streptococcus sp.]|uniref:hypothetical protein n=1 Tax=uncultured Streptococcus sp. TaxID=83427 RepID=UPI00265D7BD9|nr:hypothetical protein [uncultured Streptococcus sp.]
MTENNSLRQDIEALSAERAALEKEVEALKAKRDDLFEGVRDAEQMKSVAWDSFYALADYLRAEEKQREFANNYWGHVSGDLKIDMEFVLSRGLRFKRLLSQGQFDLVSQELDVFEKELDDLARSFGVELDRLPEEPSPID